MNNNRGMTGHRSSAEASPDDRADADAELAVVGSYRADTELLYTETFLLYPPSLPFSLPTRSIGSPGQDMVDNDRSQSPLSTSDSQFTRASRLISHHGTINTVVTSPRVFHLCFPMSCV